MDSEDLIYSESDDIYYAQFAHAALDMSRVMKLLEIYGDPGSIYKAPDEELKKTGIITGGVLDRFLRIRSEFDPESERTRLEGSGIFFVSFFSDRYPERLKNINDPPVGLFFCGTLPESLNPAVAVVGSRECSNYGREMAISISKGIARVGIDVVSGMAAGVDGYAHRGALNGGGRTFAVLGCGVDVCYPAVNRDIYTRIPENGGILSEYYPGSQPMSFCFPKRNRIISGLSDAVLVVEARERSGSWITVDAGLEQGKDIYAVPGRAGDRLSKGCNNLIKNGAKIVTCAEDIIEELAPRYLTGKNRYRAEAEGSSLSGDFKKIYDVLEFTPVPADEIAVRSGMPVYKAVSVLSRLEIEGKCIKIDTGYAKSMDRKR